MLRSIEVYGFKSFADKIHIDLNYGVTAIVGPNGSGKSNISDAVRWALGEQSNKLLRSTKMEDVIFSGSSNRRPLGIAEVSLIFDNSDGHLALDFNEIIITRRVFRSGESEYYINKTACRLKDINELLTDTGIGKDTMTVIGQNKVDEVLSSKPEDRRLLFEEAAGISKYKNRKREALKKLETTEQNLIRLRDIILEIESQLEPLEESANKTRIYNELNSELKACQITILVDKLNKAEKMVVSSETEIQTLNENTFALKTELSLKESEKEQLHLTIIDLEKEILSLNQSISNADTELEKISGKNAVLDERINQSIASKEKLISNISKTILEEENLKKEIENLNNLYKNTKNQISDLNNFLENKNSSYNSLILHIEKLEHQVNEGREKTFYYLQQMVDERNALRTLNRDLENLKLKATNLTKEQNEYLIQIKTNTSKKEDLIKSLKSLKENLQAIESKLQQILKARDKNLAQLNELKLKEEKNNKNSAQVFSHLNALKHMQQDFEGFNKAIKSVLKSPLNKSNSYKAVAELINVSSKYVTAVETALGSAIQNIVTEHENAATEAIEFLKNNKSGRATFLPLNTLKILNPNKTEENLAKSKEALGFLCDFVKTDKKYAPIIKFLLGRTILSENIENALYLAKKLSFSTRIVTLSGEIIRPGGSITGGATVHQDNGFLSRKNRIRELENDLVELAEEAKLISKNISKTNSELDAASLEIKKINEEKQEIEIKQAELKIVIEQNLEEANRLHFALNTIENEISLVKNEKTDISKKIIEKGKLLISLQDEDDAQKNTIMESEEELKTTKLNLDISNTEVTDLKVKISALTQEINAQNENLIKYEKSKETLSLEKNSLVKEKSLLDQIIAKAKNEIFDLTITKKELELDRKQSIEIRDAKYVKKLETLNSTEKLDKQCKDLHRKNNDILRRSHDLELLYAKYSSEKEHSLEQLSDLYKITPEEAQLIVKAEKKDILLSKIQELENKIIELGSINQTAIEEFEKVSERHTFLSTQLTDLTDAKESLNRIIKDIDNTMSKQFSVAFKEISTHFNEIFKKLFGGGTAKLQFNQPDNILETGIEIIVEPPGKKLQNLTLLSGGERALTVIALLFAFLSYRPAPFCIVDEIDANLDEANIERFCNFLRDYANNTQFIVVTHRKKTMESATVLHGITMEDSGVSKLVSVKLIDNAKLA